MKQEESSMSGDPCSPSSHMSSSTPSSHCSSRPASPRSAAAPFATPNAATDLGIDTGELGDCLVVDGSEFDQYLPPPPPPPGQYHHYSRDCGFTQDDEESRYHELQPGGQVKPERYCQASSGYFPTTTMPSTASSYYPGYQYVPPPQSRAPSYPSYVINSPDNWTNYV